MTDKKIYLGGLDIGGTKCAVTLAGFEGGKPEILGKVKFPTPSTPGETLMRLGDELSALVEKHGTEKVSAVGISCGGPLDPKRGLALSPPNLPGWDELDVVTPFRKRFHVPAAVQNDANACALAEWKWGAGRGTENMVFLTFGTGYGAGLILDGRLYEGTNGMAGETGHVRLRQTGPVGFGKAGSCEGFCSGGGIARLARERVEHYRAEGRATAIAVPEESLENITALRVGLAAQEGDPLALEIWELVGERLGESLSILIDLFNPQRLVIGSIFVRQEKILRPPMERAIAREAIPHSAQVCTVVPAELGEELGDYAALSVAAQALENGRA